MTWPIRLRILAALAVAMAGAMIASPASAQATRTWVSGVGDDANPCSRTAPCKTFAGAISKTAASGEINCLDPGGFGGVTITKSITIDCRYTEGGVLVSGTNGIIINAAATDRIYLGGLDIFGANTGLAGVRFIAGGTLTIENSVIRRFNGANSTGVSFAPTGSSTLILRNVSIGNNGNGTATSGGVDIRPTGAGAAGVFIQDSLINNNSGFGISATGAVFARVGNTTILNNSTGLEISGAAQIVSYADNRLDGNGVDGAFSGTIPKR